MGHQFGLTGDNGDFALQSRTLRRHINGEQ